MLEYTHIGETKIRFDDFEQNNSNTRHKLMTRQKVNNILVDCEYYESKPNNGKYFSFLVTIKVFGKHPSTPLHWYEIYANTANTKYNHLYSCTKCADHTLTDKEEVCFNKIMQVIVNKFEDFTLQFINTANKVRLGEVSIDCTPSFIIDMINQTKIKMATEKALNKN